jgi:ABC-type transporter Mla subunit MlaD
LGPYRQFETSGAELIEAHEKKERNLAQLQKSLNEAMANVQSTAGNVAKFKELQMSYRQAAKQIADEYNRDISATAAAAAANNSAKKNNVSPLALLKNSNMKLNRLQQQIQQLQSSTPPIKI